MKKLLALISAALILVSLLPAAHALQGNSVVYDQDEYEKLTEFFDFVDADGVRNGDKIAPDFPPEDPDDWIVFTTPYYIQGVFWSDDGHEAHVTSIELASFSLAGELDLSGFEWLEDVFIMDNELTGIDVSGSEQLDSLICSMNELTHIELDDTPSLEMLELEENRITAIDLSGCPSLNWLNCGDNELSEIDLSPCPGINILNCFSNELTDIDVSGCDALEILDCSRNMINELDISGNAWINDLNVSGNPISSLDLTHAAYLESLNCSDTGITELDLSKNRYLYGIDCVNTGITKLDLSRANELFLDEVRAEGSGTICCVETGYYTLVTAEPGEGSRFVGWYSADGKLLTRDMEFGGAAEFDDETDDIIAPDPVAATGEKVWIAVFDDGSAEPTDPPAEPTEPPAEPVEPTDPVEPTEPTDPDEPAEPVTDDPGAPQSGSGSYSALGIALAVFGSAAIIAAGVKMKKKDE